MQPTILSIANQKGGVGKTTTCANLGIGLAQEGKRVPLVDGDPQASLTISLGWPQPDKLPVTLSTLIGRALMDEPIRAEEAILHHTEGVDMLPASIALSGMEVSLVNAMSRETVLRQVLDSVKRQYSHILIDCTHSRNASRALYLKRPFIKGVFLMFKKPRAIGSRQPELWELLRCLDVEAATGRRKEVEIMAIFRVAKTRD